MAHATIPYYNLSAPVGKGCPNHGEDVRVIESLLLIPCKVVPFSRWLELAAERKLTPPKALLRVTGVYSDELLVWIDLLLALVDRVDFLKSDGQVDPLPEPQPNAVQTHYGRKARFLYLLCRQAASTNMSQYLAIQSQQGLKFNR